MFSLLVFKRPKIHPQRQVIIVNFTKKYIRIFDWKCKYYYFLVTNNENDDDKNTIQLKYLSDVVMKAILKHKYAWPFQSPVDGIQFPDYYKIIKHPMDFGTIKKQLEQHYYHSAKECIEDFNTVFTNCYTYNKAGEDVEIMGRTLNKLFLTKIAKMPMEEGWFVYLPC